MNSEDSSIEFLKNKLFKIENELKAKRKVEEELSFEVESLIETNEKQTNIIAQLESTIENLKVKIENKSNDCEQLEFLQNENELLSCELKTVKAENNSLHKTVKDLSKRQVLKDDSHEKIRKLEYKFNNEIQDLRSENDCLCKALANKSAEIQNILKVNSLNIESYQVKIDELKDRYNTLKQEKDELECEYLTFQTEVNKPDFDRHGNNLYAEVEDRRVLAETKLLEFQKELVRLRKLNGNLREFLEKSFDEYSELKECEIRQSRRELMEKNERLKREVDVWKMNCECFKSIQQHVDDSASEHGESFAVLALKIEKRRLINELEKEKHNLNEHLINNNYTQDRLKELIKQNKELLKTNSLLTTQVSDLEAKLNFWDEIIPLDKKQEFENRYSDFVQSNKQMGVGIENCPLELYGPYYINAKNSNKLVFGPSGFPVENDLTRRILKDNSNCYNFTQNLDNNVQSESDNLNQQIIVKETEKSPDQKNVHHYDINQNPNEIELPISCSQIVERNEEEPVAISQIKQTFTVDDKIESEYCHGSREYKITKIPDMTEELPQCSQS